MKAHMDDPLKDLHHYSSEMSVSQVIKFFGRKGIAFTKTMIQNYVRVGVLDPPDGRVYRERHMKTLVMIELLKPVYSLDEIKCMFGALDIDEHYIRFFEAFEKSAAFWRERAADEAKLDYLLEISAFCAAAKRVSRETTGVFE